MGTIAIAVDGKQVFNWQGDEVEAEQILRDFRRAARHVGLTPEEFSYNCVRHLGDGRLLWEGRVSQEDAEDGGSLAHQGDGNQRLQTPWQVR